MFDFAFPFGRPFRTKTCLSLVVTLAGLIACGGPLIAQTEPSSSPSTATKRSLPIEPPAASNSRAERIAGLRKLVEADQQRLTNLRQQLVGVQEQFDAASDTFTRLDEQLTRSRAIAAESRGGNAIGTGDLSLLEEKWRTARDDFNRVIARRDALQQQLDIVAEKIELEQRNLERLEQPGGMSAEEPPQASSDTPETPDDTSTAGKAAAEANAEDTPRPSGSSTSLLIPGLSTLSGNAAEAEAEATEAPAEIEEEIDVDENVIDARRELEERQTALQSAQAETESLDHEIDIHERDLANAELSLETARAEATAAQTAVQNQQAELQARSAAADEEELQQLRDALATEQERLREALTRIAQETTRVTETQAEIQRLREARSAAVDAATKAASQVQRTTLRLWFLESPLSPYNIRRWFAQKAPWVAAVVLLVAGLWWLVRTVTNRYITRLVFRSRQGTPAEREQRAETLRRVFLYVAGVVFMVAGFLAVLSTSGIDVSVLLGGAAVLGAAIAFGSQNLIKDYFSGFMILAENQYSVGNVIRIADTVGVVEDISLRMTVLRDEEGTVHFVPHGQITKVSNLTHGWSRAVLRIAVGYSEDVDRVMEVLMDVAREMRDDEKFGPMMLGDPEMQGVDAFDESAVVVKILLKTRPLMQWNVRREMLRRTKKRFDKLGIEIPFPQRVIHQIPAPETSARDRVHGDRSHGDRGHGDRDRPNGRS